MKRCFSVVISIVIVITSMLAFSGCTQEDSIPEPADGLTLYVSDYNADVINYALEEFKQLYPAIHVTVTNFTSGDFSSEKYEEYKSTLQTELAAGAGPDLIVYPAHEVANLYKLSKSGGFSNINDFIEADATFDLSLCNEAVMDAGVVNEQRYFTPLSYYIEHLITTEENLEYFDVAIAEDSSFEEITAELSGFCERNENNTNVTLNNTALQLYLLFPWSGVELFDCETMEPTVNTQEFRQMMGLYKTFYPFLTERESYVDQSAKDSIVNHNSLFHFNVSVFSYVTTYSDLLSKESNQTPLSFHLSSNDQTVAQPESYAAINANSDNQYNAYLFLKVLLGSRTQSSSFLNTPVLKEAAVNQLSVAFKRYDSYNSISDEIQEEFIKRTTRNITVNKGYSEEVVTFVWEHMEPYFKGEKDYDSCLAELENKLQLYLNE